MDRKGLGRGLSALIPGSDAPQGVSEIEVSRIDFNPFQPRKSLDEGSLEELTASVKVHGVIQPIVVRAAEGGQFQLVAGERRLRAARAAGLKTIPAVVRDMEDQQSLEVALIENIQREDINAIDAAVAYRRLIDEFNLSQEEISERVGKSRPTIANTLRLLQLPERVRERVATGELSEGHARALLLVKNPTAIPLIADDLVRRQCSVREAERICKSWNNAAKIARENDPPQPATHLAAVEEQLRHFFKTRVRVVGGEDKGRIEIEFYGEEDLNRILELIGGVFPQARDTGPRF